MMHSRKIVNQTFHHGMELQQADKNNSGSIGTF